MKNSLSNRDRPKGSKMSNLEKCSCCCVEDVAVIKEKPKKKNLWKSISTKKE